MKKARALKAYIYKNRLFNGCSNHGISERHDDVLVLCDDGIFEVDLDNPPDNLCKIVTRNLGFGVHTHIEPYAKPTGCSWMAGGSVVWTSDSRFGSSYPLSFHDRTESAEEQWCNY